MKYCGIIFDLDGIESFSGKYHGEAWRVIAEELGIEYNETLKQRLRGVNRTEGINILLEQNEQIYSSVEKSILAEIRNDTFIHMLDKMTPSDFPTDVLKSMKELKKRGCRLAVTSSKRNLDLILQHMGLEHFFDAVCDGSTVRTAGPNPILFETAADRLEVPIKQCLVVADTVASIRKAITAGFDVAAIGIDKKELENIKQVKFTIRHMSDLVSWMDQERTAS